MALVELRIPPLAAHVRTARLVVVAAARRAGLEDEYLDDLRLALGEACSRAVTLHAAHAPDVAVTVTVRDDAVGLTVSVHDRGPQAGPAPADVGQHLLDGDLSREAGVGVSDSVDHHIPDEPGPVASDPDVALALVTGLVEDVQVEPGAAGTVVTMRWRLPVRMPASLGGATS